MIVNKEFQEKGAKTFTKAFFDYPMFEWCLPDETRRKEQLSVFFKMIVSHGVRYGSLESTSTDYEGFMHYLPPSVPAPGTLRWMRCGGLKLIISFSPLSIKRLEIINTIVDEMRDRCIQAPHFYIMQVGVDPAHQGKGNCRLLFNKLFAISEAVNQPCYLETMKIKNVDIYKHFGFSLADERKIPGSPLTVYGMIR